VLKSANKVAPVQQGKGTRWRDMGAYQIKAIEGSEKGETHRPINARQGCWTGQKSIEAR
jgi:hypothetical protein